MDYVLINVLLIAKDARLLIMRTFVLNALKMSMNHSLYKIINVTSVN